MCVLCMHYVCACALSVCSSAFVDFLFFHVDSVAEIVFICAFGYEDLFVVVGEFLGVEVFDEHLLHVEVFDD